MNAYFYESLKGIDTTKMLLIKIVGEYSFKEI